MEIACKEIRDQFALMLYGELSFDQEERVESHLDGCAECRAALARQKELHEAMDASAVTPSPALLASSRQSLSQRLDHETRPGWWREILSGLNLRLAHPILQPLGAMALLAMGFFGAKLETGYVGAALTPTANARVREVVAQQDGQVRIILDETRRRTVSGRLDDERIRALLVSAAKEAPDAVLRSQTVTILVNGMNGADTGKIREALVFALTNDQSDAVRAKAMEGLRPFAQEQDVQEALAALLVQDAGVGVRTQAIDLLNQQRVRPLDRRMVGSLQELMIREDDRHVREEVRRMLEAVKASPDVY